MKQPEEWQLRVFGEVSLTLPASAQKAQLDLIRAIQEDAFQSGFNDGYKTCERDASSWQR